MEFNNNQNVQIIKDHLHLKASDTVYQVAATNKIQGQYSVVLLLNGASVGAVNQDCLALAKRP